MEIKPQDIKDFLHLYLNSVDVIIESVSDEYKSHFGHAPGHKTQLGPMLWMIVFEGHVKIKPILRNLSDMTEEEREKLFDHLWPTGLWGIAWSGKIDVIDHILDLQDHWSDLGERVQNILSIKVMSAMLNWLRKNSFDADGLIPAGLAIDKTSLKN